MCKLKLNIRSMIGRETVVVIKQTGTRKLVQNKTPTRDKTVDLDQWGQQQSEVSDGGFS